MFKRLLIYNWSLFLNSLTRAQTIITLIYALLIGLMLFNLGGGVFYVALFSLDSSRHNIEWLTPEILNLLLLVLANGLWLVQLILSGERHFFLSENRKLLSFGYPVKQLSRDLAILTFLHPLNLGLNIVWLLFLLPRSPTGGYLIIPIALLLNYFLLIYFKSRLASFFKKRFLWLVGFLVTCLLSLIVLLSKETVTTWLNNLDPKILIDYLQNFLSLSPGGLLEQTLVITSKPIVLLVSSIIMIVLIMLLARNQRFRLRSVLLSPAGVSSKNHKRETRSHWSRFKALMGNSGGKYNYYVLQHPYTRLQLFMTVSIAAICLPILISESTVTLFMLYLFGMLIPLGLFTLFVYNLFGFEKKEWLLNLQFPEHFNDQIRERFLKGMLIPCLAFIVITIFELFFSGTILKGVFLILKNIFMCLIFFLFSFWSSFKNYKSIPWFSYNQWTNPIVPQSVSLILSFLFMFCGIIVYYPSPALEPYIMIFIIVGIIFASIQIRKNLRRLAKRFRTNILPQLWNAQ